MLRYFRIYECELILEPLCSALQSLPALDIGQYGEWDITEIGDPRTET